MQVSILQMWNGPVEIAIEDLFIILGPNLNVVSHDDSFIEENDHTVREPYDDSNMFNIFEHQLKLRKKGPSKFSALLKILDEEDVKKKIQRQNTIEQQQQDKQTFDFIKNMKLKINKLHVRYEDDYLNGDSPFSFGLVIDVSLSPLLKNFNTESIMGIN